MNISDRSCPIFRRQVMVISDCSPEECSKWIRETFNLPEESEAGPCKDWSGGTIILQAPNGAKFYIVWVENSKDLNSIRHEALHLANSILDHADVEVTNHDTELHSYYGTYWIGQIEGAIKEGKKRASDKKRKKDPKRVRKTLRKRVG